jgi:hypothetical protein
MTLWRDDAGRHEITASFPPPTPIAIDAEEAYH